MCHNCDWRDYYCEECGECFDDCCCNDIGEDKDIPENNDCIRCELNPETCGHWNNSNTRKKLSQIEADMLCTFEEINDWLLRGHFGLCSYYLRTLCVNKLSTAQMINILTATLPASAKLQDRLGFYNRVHDILLKREENANTLLSGLRGNKYDPAPPEESLKVVTLPLPCPFCGGEVAPYEIVSMGQYYIQCYNNDCEVNPSIDGPSDSEEEVIRKWNKRSEKS